MARMKIEQLGEGQHPSEVIVAIRNAAGETETMIVDYRSIKGNTIDVGYPVGGDETRFLVELPRETVSGKWRVWVKRDDVLEFADA